MYRELRELGIPLDAMGKLNFLMTMENVATYIRDDFHKTVDETTVYASLKVIIDGTDIHFLKVNSPCRVCKVTKQG